MAYESVSYLDVVNETPVPTDLLGKLVLIYARSSPADQASPRSRTLMTLDLLQQETADLEPHVRHALAMALEYRVAAFVQLQLGGSLEAILGNNRASLQNLHPALLQAAAEHPLVEDYRGMARFDPDGFRRKVLSLHVSEPSVG